MLSSLEMTKIAAKALDTRSGRDITVLKTRDVTVLADYFIICTANNATHIKTLTDEVERKLEEQGETVIHVEGYCSGGWALLDYGCLIIHLFTAENRQFYALERLWGDAPQVVTQELLAEEKTEE